LEMEPELAQLDQLLEDDGLFARVKDDLARRYPNSARPSLHPGGGDPENAGCQALV
jgi:hypothetical protein